MDLYLHESNNLIKQHVKCYFKDSKLLENPVKYSLHGGKRIRASIVLDVCRSVSGGKREAGICSNVIEYIHTASLVIDDLPCMDNALTRREQKSVHVKYGEAVAQLVSVTLISMAMDSISKGIKDKVTSGELTNEEGYKLGMFIMENLSFTIGNRGASGGQLLDLSDKNDVGEVLKEISKETSIEEIIEKKTGTFFETSFLLGWILGGGEDSKREIIKVMSKNFSELYQIVDDIIDMKEDEEKNKKNVNQNYALKYGKETAKKVVKERSDICKEMMRELGIESIYLTNVIEKLLSMAESA